MDEADLFRHAQRGLADIKSAVYGYMKLQRRSLKNAEIGRALGIYGGHKGHVGHLSRLALELLKADGMVEQADDKSWTIIDHRKRADSDPPD